MLTAKQRELLVFINSRVKETGISPSFDEMKEALELKSKSGIHRLITALEERGFIKRLAHRARALEVIRLPDDLQESTAPESTGFTPSVIEGSLPDTPTTTNTSENSAVDVAVLGRIAAGTPISAIQHEQDRFCVPKAMLGTGEHYALEVQGDSMIEAGIHDGDYVVIQRSDDATSGDIVVALVDDEEATLKRIRKKGDSIALEPANAAYETRIFGPNRVKVQGKLIGLMRHY